MVVRGTRGRLECMCVSLCPLLWSHEKRVNPLVCVVHGSEIGAGFEENKTDARNPLNMRFPYFSRYGLQQVTLDGIQIGVSWKGDRF